MVDPDLQVDLIKTLDTSLPEFVKKDAIDSPDSDYAPESPG